jgi:phospholipase/carboxylesterase
MHVIAPQATGNTWYPYSFMAAEAQNQPFLDAALALLHELVEECVQSGIDAKHIHIAGFSQGACLAAEFVARRGEAMGSLHVYSGGLIGQDFQPEKYSGQLTDMPVFIGCSDVDAHIPLSRVKESTAQFRAMGANVDERIYAGAPHSIFEDELQASRGILG